MASKSSRTWCQWSKKSKNEMLEELVSERKVAETGSTHQMHPQWQEPTTWDDDEVSKQQLSGLV
jgi:hypothetical protein